MIEKQWVFTGGPVNDDLFRNILKGRGIESDQDVEEFLSPSPQLTYDPFLLKDMEAASERILRALEAGEKICIYGDYDADGICSVSLLMDIFNKLGADFFYYIPSRFDEGYGLSFEAIDKLKEKGTKLIVTVDCGIASALEVAYAKDLGIETIVTDHHNPGDELPDCLTVNPKQETCPYPEKNLSGCGVAFKLAQALERKQPESLSKRDLNSVLDLVAIATVGDIVALQGENRTLTKYGLRSIGSGQRLGLTSLLKEIGIDLEGVRASQITYGIVPHLNAAGRMYSADLAVDLLTSKDSRGAERLAKSLVELNQDRKDKQNKAFQEALDLLEGRDGDEKFIVLKLPEAHEGVTGIVAGKVKDVYNLPTLIFTPLDQDQLKGTGRSIAGIDLYKLLYPNKDMFEKFGGHEGACGLSMEAVHFDQVKANLLAQVGEVFENNKELFTYKLAIEGILDPAIELWQLAESLDKMEPFGQGNPRPLLMFKDVIIDSPFYMGDQNKHVRFMVNGVNCILFGGSERVKKYHGQARPVDLAGYLEFNYWNGETKLQFMVEDIRHSEKE